MSHSVEESGSQLYAVAWVFNDQTGEERVKAPNYHSAAKNVSEMVAKRMGSSVKFVRIAAMSKLSP